MIVRPKASFFDILFAVRGSIAGRVAWRCLFITVLACIVVFTGDFHLEPMSHLGTAPFGLIGIAISIFMSFRNSAAYDRWWASVQPQLVNEKAIGPGINPFKELYEKQFGKA